MGKYTNIDDPSAHFQVALHSSANAATITNDGNSDLQPDLIWSKARGAAYNHGLYDSTRGVTKFLSSNAASAETTASSGFDLTSFNTDGFSTGNNQYNTICGGTTYAAWQWKANGGTTASNTDGNITSTVQANTDAGFSIVTWTGNEQSAASVGHGLGVKPDVVIFKNRSTAYNWVVYLGALGQVSGNWLNAYLDLTNAAEQNSSTDFTSTLLKPGSGATTNASSMIAYCFAEKQGYSKFGKYVGNGNTNGAFIYTGFKPAFVMVKAITSGKNWDISTGAVSSNQIDERLRANLNNAEESSGHIDFLSNGFKMRNTNGTQNSSGVTYIYMAFAENPFVTSTGIPTTAR